MSGAATVAPSSPAASGEAVVGARRVPRAWVHARAPSVAVHGRAVVHVAARCAVGEQAACASLLISTSLLLDKMPKLGQNEIHHNFVPRPLISSRFLTALPTDGTARTTVG